MKFLRHLSTPRTYLVLALVVLAGTLLLRGVSSRAFAAELDTPEARKPVPNFVVKTMDGRGWNLESHKGKVVLVNLFATWCPPCRAEMPGLVKTVGEYREKGVDSLALSLDQNALKVVPAFVAKYKMDFPVGYPGDGPSIADGVSSIPVTLLIDRSGRLAQTYVGMVDEQQLRHDLDQLLGEPR
jgi:thiol-disulfide isomerase/thioredoxin